MKVCRNRHGEWCIAHRVPTKLYQTTGEVYRYERIDVSPYATYEQAKEAARRAKEQEERQDRWD